MRRRDLMIMLAGSAAAWPLCAQGQAQAKPVIGFLGGQSASALAPFVTRFHEGLRESGYVDGRDTVTEYRWANNKIDDLRTMAADLVQHHVALIIVSGGLAVARAAQAATQTIPILFVTGLDPVENGFVASLNRPGGNTTGVSNYTRELVPKRLEMLKELVPSARTVAYLMNSDDTGLGEKEKKQIEDERQMASSLMLVVEARTEPQIEAAFATAVQQGAQALIVAADPFFLSRRTMIVALAERHKLPVGYRGREFAEAGGLMSYGPNLLASYRQLGQYAAKILGGANPADLPVQQSTDFELIINGKTAAALGLKIPARLRAIADEVID